jgi:hypothetical protein
VEAGFNRDRPMFTDAAFAGVPPLGSRRVTVITISHNSDISILEPVCLWSKFSFSLERF